MINKELYKDIFEDLNNRVIPEMFCCGSDRFFNWNVSDFSKEAFERLEQCWLYNKQSLYDLFGKQLQVQYSHDLNFLDVQTSFFEKKKDNFVQNHLNKSSEYCKNISDETLRVFREWIYSLSCYEFYTNKTQKGFSRFTYDEYGCADQKYFIPEKVKVGKYFKTFFKEDDKANLEALQQEYSKLTQVTSSNSNKAKLFFSIHPFDYLSISDNENSWSSCHNSKDGDYRVGNFEYLQDSVTFIAYLANDSTTGMDWYGEPWNSKKWRVLIHGNKDNFGKWKFIINKQYPYYNEVLLNAVHKFLEELTGQSMRLIDSDHFYTTAQYNVFEEYINISDKNTFYCDFYEGACTKLIVDKDISTNEIEETFVNHPLYIGEDVPCFICGEAKCCSDSIAENYPVCTDCVDNFVHSCSHCGEYLYRDSQEYFTEDGKCLCGSCAETYYVPNEYDEYVPISEAYYNKVEHKFTIEETPLDDVAIVIKLNSYILYVKQPQKDLLFDLLRDSVVLLMSSYSCYNLNILNEPNIESLNYLLDYDTNKDVNTNFFCDFTGLFPKEESLKYLISNISVLKYIKTAQRLNIIFTGIIEKGHPIKEQIAKFNWEAYNENNQEIAIYDFIVEESDFEPCDDGLPF